MQNHFSVNLAAETLERTRRTIKRALRNTPPDSRERGQPRWKMTTILGALEKNTTPPQAFGKIENNTLSGELERLYTEFDGRYDEVRSAPTLAKRRKLAFKLAPLIAQTDRLQRLRDAADGLDHEHVCLRADRIFYLIMLGFETPCGWSHDQTWANLDVRE